MTRRKCGATLVATSFMVACGGDSTPDTMEQSTTMTAATLGAQTVLSNREYLTSDQYSDADTRNGELQAQVCRACHSLKRGGPTLIGPNLFGMFGETAGTRTEYDYSQVLADSGFVWTPRALEAWLSQPANFLPGNRMSFPGVPDAGNRIDLIAYLLTVTDASGVWITLNLPPELRDKPLRLRYLFAGMDDYAAPLAMPDERIVTIPQEGKLQVHAFPTRYYQTILIDAPGDTWAGYPVQDDGAVELVDGWWLSDWFGIFNIDCFPWIFHTEHAWMFVFDESTAESIFLYDYSSEGWWFTVSDLYPYLFSSEHNAWVFYFEGTAAPRQFVNLQTEEFFSES